MQHCRSIAPSFAPSLALVLCTHALAGGGTAGDDCYNALSATVGLNAPVNTLTMFPSVDPPANGPCAYLNWTAGTRDAWWNFNAPIDGGVLSLDFCPSTYDTSVVVYQGDCGALTRVACDDDSCQPLGPTYQSRISDLPVAGGNVFVRVGGYGGATGTAQFSLDFKPQGRPRAWGPATDVYRIPADLSPVIAVAAGGSHGLAVMPDGTVRAWGFNCCGQATVPADLGAVRAVAAGGRHSMALRRDGQVRAWGLNWKGQATVPVGLGVSTAITAGSEFSAALTAASTVRVWGSSLDGVQAVPTGLGAVRAIAAGTYHMLAIRGDGTVAGWGGNTWGQSTVPADLGTVTAIAAGTGHSVALLPDGSIRGWGDNSAGQRTAPADLGPVTMIAAGGAVTTTVDAHGHVRSWGRHNYVSIPSVPEVPSDLGPSVAVATSAEFSVAVTLTNPCAGDVDLTGKVDGADIGVLLSSWGPAPAGASTDTNHDGMIDGADLGVLLSNWGTCG